MFFKSYYKVGLTFFYVQKTTNYLLLLDKICFEAEIIEFSAQKQAY